MKEVPLTQGKFAVVDDEDYELVSAFNWKYSNKGYAAKNYQEEGRYKTLLMHRLILKPKDGVFVDHIDGNPLNNKRSNLREVTNRQNCLNQKITKRNTSGYKGVHWSKFHSKWSVTVRDSNSKQVHLGYFENKHDAARMYNFWASDLYGEYARLNVIKEEENK